jgi:hypothetical protein
MNIFHNKHDIMHISARRICIVIICVALAVIAAMLALYSTPHSVTSITQKGMYCSEATKDFGHLDAAGDLEREHVFLIVNGSQRQISIQRVRSSCGCTISSIDNSVLAPGQEARISVTVRWSPTLGRQSVALTVDSDDTPSRLPLSLVCDVVTPLQASTDTVDFGVLKPGQHEIRTIRIAPRSQGRAFRIVNTSIASPHLSVQAIEYHPDGVAEVQMTMSGQDSQLDEVIPIAFNTSLESCPSVHVTATAKHQGCMSAEPSVLLLPFGHAGTEISRQIIVNTLGSNAHLPLRISLEFPEGIDCDVSTIAPSTGATDGRSTLTLKARHRGNTLSSQSGIIRLSQGTAAYELRVLITYK